MRRFQIVSFSFVVALLLIFNSCSTISKINKSRAPFISQKKLLEKVLNINTDFTTLHFQKVNLHFEDPGKSYNVNSDIRIQKDSLIQISVRPGFGIEAFRIGLQKDSIIIINRLKKEVLISSYSYLTNQYGIKLDFDDIQNILLARYFNVEGKYNGKVNFVRKENYILSRVVELNLAKLLLTDIVDKDKRIIKKTINCNQPDIDLNIEYKDYIEKDKLELPSKIDLHLKKGLYHYEFRCKYKKVEIDKKVKFSLKFSSKYKVKRLAS